MEYTIFEILKEAYETTTQSYNRFAKAIKSIAWDSTFKADGETYYIKGNLTLTVENINPFKESWKPEALFTDGSCLTF